MIPVSNAKTYAAAIAALGQHKVALGGAFKGRFIQIFLGLKFYQNQIPSMFSGMFIETGVLQSMLDDMYAKRSLPPQACVLMIFEGTYLARTGVKGVGNTTAQNTWRNNFNIQKGIGCYAEPGYLTSLPFLNQSRSQCQFLSTPGHLAGGQCTLCPGATYRNEDHRKWLRIDPGGAGYAATDVSVVANFKPYVAPQQRRLPLIPLVLALYYDGDPGLPLGSRQTVSKQDFMADFNLDDQEYVAYFDASPSNPQNAAVLAADPSISLVDFASAAPSLSAPSPGQPPAPSPAPLAPAVAAPALPGAPILGTVVQPPAVNTGWGAQKAVIVAMQTAGWEVHDVSRQQLGYDLLAKKGTKTLCIEVKSSLGACYPALTAREWTQALRLGAAYVLAVVENFKETTANTILWIPDPAHQCAATPVSTLSHAIPRSSWMQHLKSLATL